MADKKKTPEKSHGVVGLVKKIVGRESKDNPKSTAKPKASGTTGSKSAAAPKTKASSKEAAAKTKASAKAPAPAKGSAFKSQAKGQSASPSSAPSAEGQVKRKPPSITITRPETTRPPAAQMPVARFEPPIGAPAILLPRDGQPVGSPPVFRWMSVGGATRYELEWSPDSHFGRGHGTTIPSNKTAITLEGQAALKPGANYHWRVRGGNDAGWGPWSSAQTFRVSEKI